MKKEATISFRDDSEPTIGASDAIYLPMWLTGLLALLLYWGCFLVDEQGANFNRLVYAPYLTTNDFVMPGAGEDADIAIGRANFKMVCAPCHQDSGLGIAGQFPPLVASEWVTTPSPARLIRIAAYGVNGPLKVKGVDWNHSMFAAGAAMDDATLAAVLSYVRTAWGNAAPKVTAEMVGTVRAEVGPRGEPFTQEELLQVPAE